MKRLTVILYNIRSAYNVGAILRTCDGLGVDEVIFNGYTPFLDKGLPHERAKLQKQIHKTALGAEQSLHCRRDQDIYNIIRECQGRGMTVFALEQGKNSLNLATLDTTALPQDLALILGEEVHGIPPAVTNACDALLEIPMLGQKESFNVASATAIALWELRRRDLANA